VTERAERKFLVEDDAYHRVYDAAAALLMAVREHRAYCRASQDEKTVALAAISNLCGMVNLSDDELKAAIETGRWHEGSANPA
jgi:hypothetical protein